MVYLLILFIMFPLLLLGLPLVPGMEKAAEGESRSKSRHLFEIKETYGPLILPELEELAWPPKQLISIKHPNDVYGRWATVEDIKDNDIKYIGTGDTGDTCWLRLDGEHDASIRDCHWGFVRNRGRYYIFEVGADTSPYEPDYDWWNYPFTQVEGAFKFGSDLVDLTIFRDDRPITIEGKNTNGVAVLDIDEIRPNEVHTIGSSPGCSITLPDPDLPPYLARRGRQGHHRVLYDYYASPDQGYLMRADKMFEIGGYRVTL